MFDPTKAINRCQFCEGTGNIYKKVISPGVRVTPSSVCKKCNGEGLTDTMYIPKECPICGDDVISPRRKYCSDECLLIGLKQNRESKNMEPPCQIDFIKRGVVLVVLLFVVNNSISYPNFSITFVKVSLNNASANATEIIYVFYFHCDRKSSMLFCTHFSLFFSISTTLEEYS